MVHTTLEGTPARQRAPAALPFSWRFPRWNVSRHAATFRAADSFVVSIQKSGRTWVRVFMAAYFAEPGPGLPGCAAPRQVYTHDLWEHETKGNPGERLRGKWLIPSADASRKPILLVVRDPRDVMVSLFFHLQKRTRTYGGDLPALLRHPVYGVRRIVAIMNRWLREWDAPGQRHLFRYEDAREDAAGTFAAALRFLQPEAEPDVAALERAVEIASFANMQRLEAGDRRALGAGLVAGLREEALRPWDARDPDSYKVRRGKVGGYVDYLARPDIEFLDRELEALDVRYGYRARR